MGAYAGFAVGCTTHRGLRRGTNEDTFRVPEGLYPDNAFTSAAPGLHALERLGVLFLVADGMGGHAAGERASAEACDAFLEAYYGENDGLDDPEGRMYRAVFSADRRVRTCAEGHPELKGMGTTLTAAAIRGDELAVGHVGDSRVYLLRGDRIDQVTEDHIPAAASVRRGRMVQASRTGALTQAIGVGLSLDVFVAVRAFLAGDRILLCSDGLYEMIREPYEIARIAGEAGTMQAACETLVKEANARGGRDNVTVVMIGLD